MNEIPDHDSQLNSLYQDQFEEEDDLDDPDAEADYAGADDGLGEY